MRMNTNEPRWYVVDLQPLGWGVRQQKFTDMPRDDDPPIALFAEKFYAALACEVFNTARKQQEWKPIR